MDDIGHAEISDARLVKLVVWDLDGTLWDGVLLEQGHVVPRDWIRVVITTLDQRGIINSIASRNDHAAAEGRLRELGLWDYFVYPQINWGPKSQSVRRIAKMLNIGLDAVVVVDDDTFEHAEITQALPTVRCLDPSAGETIPDLPGMKPPYLTEAGTSRRLLYQGEIARREAEANFDGPSKQFLSSLGLRLTISRAEEADLDRAAELTVRTNQLNSTGITYSREDLLGFLDSPRHLLLMVDLVDRFGTYGKIGLVLIELESDRWTIRLLLMSCRVASRGIGAVVLNRVRALARAQGVRLLADFCRNDRNRLMYVTYRFGGFAELSRDGVEVVFESDPGDVQSSPAYIEVGYRGVGPWQAADYERTVT